MNKYNNSLVYKIKCNDPNVTDSYIGSTTNFKVRCSAHKSLVTYSCENKKELLNHEKFWICALGAKLNKQMPSRTDKESKIVYYIKNRDYIIKRKKEHFDCPCGGSYSLVNKARHFKTDQHQKYINTYEMPVSADTYPSDSESLSD